MDSLRHSRVIPVVLALVTIVFLGWGLLNWMLRVNIAETRMNGQGRPIDLTPAELRFRKAFWGTWCASSLLALIACATVRKRYPLLTGSALILLWFFLWVGVLLKSMLLTFYLRL